MAKFDKEITIASKIISNNVNILSYFPAGNTNGFWFWF